MRAAVVAAVVAAASVSPRHQLIGGDYNAAAITAAVAAADKKHKAEMAKRDEVGDKALGARGGLLISSTVDDTTCGLDIGALRILPIY